MHACRRQKSTQTDTLTHSLLTPTGFARSVRWTGFLDRLTNKISPLRTAPVNPLAERESALGPLAAATIPAPTASSPAASSKQDAMAKYVKDRGGNTVIRKVRVLYIGLCVGWGERYTCERCINLIIYPRYDRC